MEQTCCARNCSSNRNTTNAIGKKVEFYSVPAVTSLREEWVKRCQLSEDVDIKRVKICEIHFEKQYFNAKGRLVFNAVPSLFFPARPPSEHKEKEKSSSSESADQIKKMSNDSSVKSSNQSNSQILLKNAYVKVERLLNVSSLPVSDDPESECQRVDEVRDVSRKKSKLPNLADSQEAEGQRVAIGKPEKFQKKKVSIDSSLAELEPQNYLLRNGEIKTSKTKKSLKDVTKTTEIKNVSITQSLEKLNTPFSRSDVSTRKRNRKIVEVTTKKDGCDIDLGLQNEIKTQKDLHVTTPPSRTKRKRFNEKAVVENLEPMPEKGSDAAEGLPQKRTVKKPDVKKKECDVPKLKNDGKRSSQRKSLTKLDTKHSNPGETASQVPVKESDGLRPTRMRRQLKKNHTENLEGKSSFPVSDTKQSKLEQMELTEPTLDKAMSLRQPKKKVLNKLKNTNTEPVLGKVETVLTEEKVTRHSKRKMSEKLQEMKNLQESQLENEPVITKKPPEKKILQKTDSTNINKSPEKLRKSSRVSSKKTEQNLQVPETVDVPELRPSRPKRKKTVVNEEENINSENPASQNPKTNNVQANQSLRVLRPKRKPSSVIQVSKSIMTEDCQEDLPQLTMCNYEHVSREMNGLNPSIAEAIEDQEIENHMKSPPLESPKKAIRKLLRSPRLRLGQKKEVEETMLSTRSQTNLESSEIFKNTTMPTLHMEISEQHESTKTTEILSEEKALIEEMSTKELENVPLLSDIDVDDQENKTCETLPKSGLEDEIMSENPELATEHHKDLDEAEPMSEELEIDDTTSNQEIEDISNIDHQVDIMLSEVNKELDRVDQPEIGKEVLHEPILLEGSQSSEEIEIIDRHFDESTVESNQSHHSKSPNDENAENKGFKFDEPAENELPRVDEIVENIKPQSEKAAENEMSQNHAITNNENSQCNEIVEIVEPQNDEVIGHEKSETEKPQINASDIENTKNPPHLHEKDSFHDETPILDVDQSTVLTEANETEKVDALASQFHKKAEDSVEDETTNNRLEKIVSRMTNDSPTNESKIIEASTATNNSSKNNDEEEDLKILCEKTTKAPKRHKYRLRIQIDKVIKRSAIPEKVMIPSKNRNSSPAITCLDIANDGDEVIEINEDKETDSPQTELISKNIHNNISRFAKQDIILKSGQII